jgi:hypothetical protein
MYPLVWLDDVSMTSPALLNDRKQFGSLLSLNDPWQFGDLVSLKICWQFGICVSLNVCWRFGDLVLLNICLRFGICVSLNVHWQFGIILSLNSINRVSSFCWTRGSKICFLACFPYFCCYFLILVFLQNCYLLISSRLSWLHGNLISCPVFSYLWHSEVVHRMCAPCFWHRMRGFFKARHSREPGSRLTTGDLFPFRLLLKVSHANVCWAIANHTFLTHKNP